MGITQGALGHYLNGYNPLNLEARIKFATILNKDVKEIWPDFNILQHCLPTDRDLTILAYQALLRERTQAYKTACTVSDLKNKSNPSPKDFGIDEVRSELKKLGASTTAY